MSEGNLFEPVAADGSQRFLNEGLDLLWIPGWMATTEADKMLKALISELAWAQGEVRMFGKWLPEPRLSAWYGDPGKAYTYAGKRQQPLEWTPLLAALRSRVEVASGARFNSVLANRYRHGQDSMGWHSDDEPELGPNPVIASLSLGAERPFDFRQKHNRKEKQRLILHHGSLLVMRGSTQAQWQHQLPKRSRIGTERINLTFRWIV